jgi:hypothetical protein
VLGVGELAADIPSDGDRVVAACFGLIDLDILIVVVRGPRFDVVAPPPLLILWRQRNSSAGNGQSIATTCTRLVGGSINLPQARYIETQSTRPLLGSKLVVLVLMTRPILGIQRRCAAD